MLFFDYSIKIRLGDMLLITITHLGMVTGHRLQYQNQARRNIIDCNIKFRLGERLLITISKSG